MTVLFGILLALVAFVVLYVMWLRKWLKTQRWADGFFAAIEPFEIALYKKSETLLVSRALWVGGLLVSSYDAIAIFATQLDWTPLTARVLSDVPEDLRGLVVSVAIGAIGLLIGWMRKRTTKPIEIVELSDANMTPQVAAAVAGAEAAKVEAVAVVNADKDPPGIPSDPKEGD
jgi:hypothetical protein